MDAVSSARNYTTRITPSHPKLKTNSAASITITPPKISAKWQVGRVSRKQYEIINMLYRKTKTFFETESTTAFNSIILSKYRGMFNKKDQQVTLPPQKKIQESLQATKPRPKDRPLTPSYIEFYYLDESDERVKLKDSIPKNSGKELQSDEFKFALLRQPLFLFRVNDATCKSTTLNYKTSLSHNDKRRNIKSSIREKNGKTTGKMYFKHKLAIRRQTKIDDVKNKTDVTGNTKDHFTPLVPITSYDRIKFFEIYDSDTYKPRMLVDNRISTINNINIQSEEKLNLDHVDQDGNNLTRFVKKHANYNFDEHEHLNSQLVNTNNSISTTMKETEKILSKHSQPAVWSDFPYIAVYVYEPMQVRCDSAAISPHWLIAAATCLHRHHRNLNSNAEGRSAYVTYCGGNWRVPGRIAYVKRSFVHPRFQAKHTSRRYLYNIGVIQVVNSMANTCSGWRPVSLMSHQFVADPDGSYANAVGWGFDRYGTRYSSSNLPTYPLMLYESLVYSDSCPGNADYSKVKMLNGESKKNVYCLSLPTYTLKKNDNVPGGLLLIGGKLIALYLQEERRPWGVQSAQYTGIWRLIPWLLDVAREVEDSDIFILDL
ncbi:uncharacterized protein LOC120625996 [Pararge aegeria]|uniref:uncharacterized protein LOC120625996 n=1 Tax=Pararge aegeria TaxID=116150 RepID=UPI0019D0C8FB|nr:uncharacterized protein LOC120625996 [Pararge aegeria]